MSISLLTLDDLRDVERRQASVLESGTLMERAGQDIASRSSASFLRRDASRSSAARGITAGTASRLPAASRPGATT